MPVKAVSALYEPINVYKPFAPSVGIADGQFEHVTLLGMKMPWPFRTRMTVIQLASGELFLHSPIAFDLALARQLQPYRLIARLAGISAPGGGGMPSTYAWRSGPKGAKCAPPSSKSFPGSRSGSFKATGAASTRMAARRGVIRPALAILRTPPAPARSSLRLAVSPARRRRRGSRETCRGAWRPTVRPTPATRRRTRNGRTSP